MMKRKSTHITLLAVIGCLLLLSLKDTLSLLHSVLHQIPNPFHHHGHGAGHSHSLLHWHGSHDSSGQLAKEEPQKKATKKDSKKNRKTTLKIDLFVEQPLECFATLTTDKPAYLAIVSRSATRLLPTPPNPPPEIS